MISENTSSASLSNVLQGDLPSYGLTCGIQFLTDFWKEKYLQEYIHSSGSKIKFVTGRPGSGKTHFLHLVSSIAREENYKTVNFSAREIWMHDFREIYLEIFRQCDIMECLVQVSHYLIQEMGFDYQEIPEGMRFIDYLSQNGMGDALTRREIRSQLKTIFLDNPMLDNNFALACSMLTGSILGYPILEEQNKELLLAWLEGDRTVKLSQLRSLGFYPCRITRYNARHMLRSLAAIIRMGGYSGLFVTIDDMEILISRSSLDPVHYTKMKREDTYESIRQLIDDIDSMKNIMFVYAFDRELIDNENAGLKSYQALWIRIQPGFMQELEKISAGSPLASEMLLYAAKHLETDKLYYLFRSYLNTEDSDEKFLLQADLEGDFIANAPLKKIYRRIFSQPVKYNTNFTKTRHCSDYFAFMSHLFTQMGYQGWVILIDETELMGRLGKKARLNACRNMAHFLLPERY